MMLRLRVDFGVPVPAVPFFFSVTGGSMRIQESQSLHPWSLTAKAPESHDDWKTLKIWITKAFHPYT